MPLSSLPFWQELMAADMTGYQEALQLLKAAVNPLEAVATPLAAALGAVLADDFQALHDVPPFARSPLDGFAFRAAGTAGASEDNPAVLQVVGTIPAGTTPAEAGLRRPLKAAEAVRIFTGAMLPDGADAVAAQEKVTGSGKVLRVSRTFLPGENVVRAGEDVVRGSLLLPARSRLGPVEIGLLAGQGVQSIAVYRRPQVAILTSGSELAEPGERLSPGRIYNSNRYFLEALVRRAGGEPVWADKLPDDLTKLASAITGASAKADMVLTTGGVSVGDHDLIPAAVRLAGAEIIFHRVAMRPGTPVLAARLGQAVLLGLSGNPAACLVTFLQFALPVLAKMQRLSFDLYQIAEARLSGGPLTGLTNQARFLASCTLQEDETLVTRPVAHQKPGVLSSFRGINSLVVLLPNSGTVVAGDRVQVQLFPTIFSETPFGRKKRYPCRNNSKKS
jgi:molybdopterin molybdotransferase